MEVNTKLNILNCHRKKICTYKTPKLTGITKRKDIENFILKKCKNFKPPFDIQIYDKDDDFVTLDDDYLEDYSPFKATTIDTTTVQSTNSPTPTVIVQIILLNYASNSIIDQEFMQTEEILETATQKNEHTYQIDQSISISKPQTCSIIRLSNDPKIGFIPDYNVNSEQRDQYPCDQINVSTGHIVGTLSMIQAPKNSANTYKSVLPRFKRSLFYHPQRAFVEKDNVKQSSNPYKIPITSDDWMSNMGMELKLIIVVIEGAKKHPDASLNILCQLEDTNESELLDSSYDYSKSRLALVLQKDDVIQWDTMVLSNEMVFKKRITTFGAENILDIPKNVTSTSSKRNRSKKQNSSKQRPKRTIRRRQKDHSSMATPPANNDDSSMHLNHGLPVYHNISQVIDTTSQTMLDISPSNSELLSDLPQTNYLSGDSININKNHSDVFNYSDYIDMDSIMLNADPSLCDTTGYDADHLLCDTAYCDVALPNL
ncbi:unnamed protein product [Rotaria sp. Silwood2]|nr:unnamed protein product [Rotaria sp. Silwood2]